MVIRHPITEEFRSPRRAPVFHGLCHTNKKIPTVISECGVWDVHHDGDLNPAFKKTDERSSTEPL